MISFLSGEFYKEGISDSLTVILLFWSLFASLKYRIGHILKYIQKVALFSQNETSKQNKKTVTQPFGSQLSARLKAKMII
jgi:hypothetical protein